MHQDRLDRVVVQVRQGLQVLLVAQGLLALLVPRGRQGAVEAQVQLVPQDYLDQQVHQDLLEA